MKTLILACAAALALAATSTARGLTIRFTGTVTSANFSSGTWSSVSVGDSATWEAELATSGTPLIPNLLAHFATLPGTCHVTIGGASNSPPGAQILLQVGPSQDIIYVLDTSAPGDGTESLRLADSIHSVLGSIDPALALGTYAITGFGSVLVNIGGGELLNLQPMVGQTGNWSVPIPTTPALCGATFSAQGYGFAPGQIALYNAYDCVVGN